MASERPITVLIGALGGEGGGVLTDWIVDAATEGGYPVQSTSIPGVAQRTGATNYYVEVFPATRAALGGKAPVMALYPAPGNIDVMVASELLETGRALEMGWVSPDRTTLVASTHRVYSILEKSAMADGIIDGERILLAGQKLAQRSLMFDMNRVAEREGSVLNAVALGVIAGSGKLPMAPELFRESIKKSGVAVASNLKGFEAGLAFTRGELKVPEAPPVKRPRPYQATAQDVLSEAYRIFPADVVPIVGEAVRRLADYQDVAYARRYLELLAPVLVADRAAGGADKGFPLTREAGRYLALWMSYEDVIRVADLKSRATRFERVRGEVQAKATEPLHITEFLKPGFEEISSILPPAMGRPLMAWAARSEKRRQFHFAMRVRTNTVTGFLRLWLLAKLKFWRPRTFRYAEEQAAIASWLAALIASAGRSYALAMEISELPNLRKGYSDTHRRGIMNYAHIFEGLARPAAAGAHDAGWAERAVRRAREAALADPEGESLGKAMAEIEIERKHARPVAMQPALAPAAE